MAIALTDPNVDTFDNANATVYTTGSWTPPQNALLVLYICNAATTDDPSSVVGNGVTWSKKASVNDGSGSRVGLWVADSGVAPTAGVITVTFAAQQGGCSLLVFALTGVDLSGGALAAVVQAPSNSGSATSGSVTLAAAGSSNNRPIVCFLHRANELTTPRAAWSEIGDGSYSGPLRGTETQWRSDAFETTASATWASNVNWAGLAGEIKAGTPPVVLTPSPLGIPMAFPAPTNIQTATPSALALPMDFPTPSISLSQILPSPLALPMAFPTPSLSFVFSPSPLALPMAFPTPALVITAVNPNPLVFTMVFPAPTILLNVPQGVRHRAIVTNPNDVVLGHLIG